MKGFTDEMLLKAYLDNMDGLCYPLLRWILMSNRAHLSLLPKNKVKICFLFKPLKSENPIAYQRNANRSPICIGQR